MSHNTVYRPYLQLARVDKPIGYWLLMWPTLWSLWLASHGKPSISLIIMCILGVLITRSAGCIINDVADHRIDALVDRTKDRPLATQSLSRSQALILFMMLMAAAAFLAFILGVLTMCIPAVLLMIIYPYSKRFLSYPQIILGVAFSWSVFIVCAACRHPITPPFLWLFACNMFWTIGYDTLYAMADKPQDIKANIRSMAIWLGDHDWHGACFCYVLAGLCWLQMLHALQPTWPCIALTIIGITHASILLLQAKSKDPQACFAAFLGNAKVGLWFWLALVMVWTSFW